jgi:RNA polymerase sigma factor (sigma-70 family)
MSGDAGERDVERIVREVAAPALAALVRRFGDFAACEDAVQEALIAGAAQWPREGVPESPRAWIVHVARRRLIDHVRSESARRRRESDAAAEIMTGGDEREIQEEMDDTLALYFMCCHPSLTGASAVALALRALGGLTTEEIGRAFLVPAATMGQRISRAKETLHATGARFDLPGPRERAARATAVVRVLYLIFNEGYATSSGEHVYRPDLCGEAIRLARELRRLMPENGDVTALLALMLLTDARREARVGPNGELIPLDEQDRSHWDRSAIEEGKALVEESFSAGRIGEYQIQAAIAALHDEAASVDSTDWRQIRDLYVALMGLTENPMVALNHAVAVAMVDGAEAGLALLEPLSLDKRWRSNHRLEAVRAHLLERAGQRDAAIESFRRAAEQTVSLPERNFLILKAARLDAER